MKPLQDGRLDVSPEYLYWTGCAANYDARIAAVVEATTKVLRAGGIRLKFLGGEEVCTGDAARRLGEEGLFQQLALQNIETLHRHSVTHIVTHCAHCFHVFKNEYPRFGGSFEIVHHAELIARLIKERRVRLRAGTKLPATETVTLHDSCYVGRYNGVFDAPREILTAVHGPAVVEMERHGRQSFCCGAGGANYWFDAPKKQLPGAIRAREAARTGARILAAECPFCIKMLEQGVKAEAPDTEMRVMDIAEIAAEALDLSDASDFNAPIPFRARSGQ